jgi:DNA polymerase III epsilon subunit family exonuclease
MSMPLQHALFEEFANPAAPVRPRRARVAPDVAMHELEYAVVDVETTGGSYYRTDRIVEVAVVIVRNGAPAESFSSLVNPCRPIPRGVSRLTGISNAMVSDAPLFDHIAAEVRGLLDSRVFVAHNVAFDWGFVNEELDRAMRYRLSVDRLCTVRLAKRLISHLPRRNLDALSAHYEVRIENRHRALGDAAATAKVFARMLDELGRQGIHTWREDRQLMTGRKKRPKRTALPHPMTDWHIA